MKRILMVLVLLLTVSLAGSVPVVQADEVTAQTVLRHATRSTDVEGSFYGPAGDPDGMGTGNGVDDPTEEVVPTGPTDANTASTVAAQPDPYLRLVLSLVQLLVY